MTRLDVRPFATADLGGAARLLTVRHRRHRQTHPRLSPAYAQLPAALAAIEEWWGTPGASGAVAHRGGDVVGYVIGAPKDGVWGPNVWVEAEASAVTEPDVTRDLYAVAASRWVDEGRTAQYAVVPADDDDVIDAWFRLGFGLQHVHALRDLTARSARVHGDPRVRPARRADIPTLARLDLVLAEHQARSPVFSAGKAERLEEAQQSWEEDFDDPAFAYFAAEHEGHVVGSSVGCPIEKSSAHRGVSRPTNAGFLGFAAVLPQARGTGLGRALGEAVVTWADGQGSDSVVTDWRATNLLASRTWPRLGFEPTFVRLHRLVGY